MSSIQQNSCSNCKAEKSKYKCPKCKGLFCSSNCYKSRGHLDCTEAFYKACIEEHLNSCDPSTSDAAMQQMFEILKRVNLADAGFTPTDLNNDGLDNDSLDSDDEEPEGIDYGKDIDERLWGVELHNSEEVWQRLTPAERHDFQCKVYSGEILNLLPEYTPWWLLAMKPKRKIEEIPENAGESKIVRNSNDDKELIPPIVNPIPKFSDLFKKLPSTCLQYNLWNVIASYGCMGRYFRGDHLRFTEEAAAVLVNLSTTLKYCTNFDNVTDALLSVEMEAIAIGSGLKPMDTSGLAVETQIFDSRDQLTYDAQKLMSTLQNKLAALSDILLLFKMAKVQVKNHDGADFQKLYAIGRGNVVLTAKNMQQFMKKIKFMLAYVNRETENIIFMKDDYEDV